MSSILIVDDEYYIVQGLMKNMNWEGLGINTLYDAYSLAQAQRVIESNQVDLVITDIEMPNGSGLELVKWMRANDYDATVLVLTGHQRFDYAQEAIKNQCFSYVLKPVDKKELEGELRKAMCARGQKEAAPVQAPPPGADSSDEQNFVKRVREVIHQNLASGELNRRFIAESIHMNPDYLSHLFHIKFGQTLSVYITSKRIDLAKELLANTELSLQRVSDKTGFSNCSYFHKQFKKSTGMTPQQFRTSHNSHR